MPRFRGRLRPGAREERQDGGLAGSGPRPQSVQSSELRVLERLREILVLIAAGAADRLDARKLGLCEVELALHDIGLTQIFADLSVARIERDRLQVIADALIDPPELARRVA
jgi:hypothetical protein